METVVRSTNQNPSSNHLFKNETRTACPLISQISGPPESPWTRDTGTDKLKVFQNGSLLPDLDTNLYQHWWLFHRRYYNYCHHLVEDRRIIHPFEEYDYHRNYVFYKNQHPLDSNQLTVNDVHFCHHNSLRPIPLPNKRHHDSLLHWNHRSNMEYLYQVYE